MNKTKIEWCRNPDGSPGFTWNPISGCLNSCSYCYARRLANGRLKQRYLANENVADNELMTYPKHIECMADPFYPRFWEERLADVKRGYHHKDWSEVSEFGAKARGVFVCDMSDLFGIGVPEKWTRKVLDAISDHDNYNDRFYLLTKQPQNLIKFSPYPPNCWVGVTATGYKAFNQALDYLKGIEARIKYISMEPLLEAIPFYMDRLAYCGINWLIIGAMTGNLEDIKKMLMEYPQLTLMPWGKQWTLQPKIEWVEEIIEVADKAGIPVFLKNNLYPLLQRHLKQELPNE